MRRNPRALLATIFTSILATSILVGCSSGTEQAAEVTELTIYSGRSEEFIADFFEEWEQESGISLNVRYGDSAELSAQILEEGSNSPADLFLSQDAGALGAIGAASLLTELPTNVGIEIPKKFIDSNRLWIGITGRARVFAYNPNTLKSLPQSVAELTGPSYKGKIGIAPTNSSFQAFLSAMIDSNGLRYTRKWLEGIKANEAKIYLKNSAIVEAIDKGEISIGLVNHYYVWEVSEALGRPINAKIEFFNSGDSGNLLNVSGAGILASSKKQSAAQDLIKYFTSQRTQEKFVKETHEYSLLEGAVGPEGLPGLNQIGAPAIDLDSLKNVKRTQDLLLEVGLL